MYVDIVISNAFNLNKHVLFYFSLSFIIFLGITYYTSVEETKTFSFIRTVFPLRGPRFQFLHDNRGPLHGAGLQFLHDNRGPLRGAGLQFLHDNRGPLLGARL